MPNKCLAPGWPRVQDDSMTTKKNILLLTMAGLLLASIVFGVSGCQTEGNKVSPIAGPPKECPTCTPTPPPGSLSKTHRRTPKKPMGPPKETPSPTPKPVSCN